MTMEVLKNSAEYRLDNQMSSPNVFYRNVYALRGKVSTRCGLIKLMFNKIGCFLLNLLLINFFMKWNSNSNNLHPLFEYNHMIP